MNNKNAFKYIIAFVVCVFIILGLIYLGLGYCYVDTFPFGTRINGIYCTGLTQEEAVDRLVSGYDYTGVTVYDSNSCNSFTIYADDIDFKYDYGSAVSDYLKSHNPWRWPLNLIKTEDYHLVPRVSIDEDKLNILLDEHEMLKYSKEPDVELVFLDGVYQLYDTTKHIPDSDKMRQAIRDAFYASEDSVVIDDSFYRDYLYTASQQELINTFNDINKMLAAEITYVMGDEEVFIDRKTLTSFLKRDEEGQLLYDWDMDEIEAWVDSFADEYDTVGADRVFECTGGESIVVHGGTYGNLIDRKAEKEFLKEAVLSGQKVIREPEYLQKAWKQGKDDIGDTYVEVNMTKQNLYYYVDGEIVIDTPVVTGNMMRRMDTPTGTNYVYFMQRNRTLHGANYETFVNYWIAVVGHIGIHDATWRNKFGEDIYLTDGSHGCINTPMDAVSKLYDMIEIGTPVVMYYTENN